MRSIARVSIMVLLCTVFAAGADVSGTWTGSITPEGRNAEPLRFTLVQDGSKVTGTGGPSQTEQYPIQNGQVKDGRITLQVMNRDRTFSFDLVVMGDEISGKAQLERGGEIRGTATVSLRPEKKSGTQD